VRDRRNFLTAAFAVASFVLVLPGLFTAPAGLKAAPAVFGDSTTSKPVLPGAYFSDVHQPALEEQIVFLRSRGITSFLMHGVPRESLVNLFKDSTLTVMIALPNHYPTGRTATAFGTQFFASESYRQLDAFAPVVQDWILFWVPQDPLAAFSEVEALTPVPRLLENASYVRLSGADEPSNRRFHELITSPEALAVRSADAASFILDTRLFSSAERLTIRTLLNSLLENNDQVYVDSNWLLTELRRDPLFGLTDATFNTPVTGKTVVQTNDHAISFISAVLAIIWLVFALHFYNDPTYRKSIVRFFFNHSFHASDIINRHIRLSGSALLITASSMVLVGVLMESVFQFLIAPVPLEILKSNIWAVELASRLPFGFFFAGMAGQGVIIGISVLWLLISLPKASHVSQILGIYAWTFHIHLVVIPLVIVLAITGISLGVVLIWGVLLLTALTLFGFYIVAWDFMRATSNARSMIYSRAIVPFTITLFLLFFLLYNQTSFGEAIVFAASVR
jgi:hypothetical protein